MPDMDGVEATRHIRGLYPDGALPGAEDRAANLAAGRDDYLAKSFEKADLTALFALGRQGQRGRARRWPRRGLRDLAD